MQIKITRRNKVTLKQLLFIIILLTDAFVSNFIIKMSRILLYFKNLTGAQMFRRLREN